MLGAAADVSGHIDVGAGAFVFHRADGMIAVWPLALAPTPAPGGAK
jgi:hypothetical protein